jgi:hypothetical protein
MNDINIYEQKLNIPVLLPIQEGVDKLIPVLKGLIKIN